MKTSVIKQQFEYKHSAITKIIYNSLIYKIDV